eukprot:9243124-Alexandrium_andersonii.AAC.1
MPLELPDADSVIYDDCDLDSSKDDDFTEPIDVSPVDMLVSASPADDIDVPPVDVQPKACSVDVA